MLLKLRLIFLGFMCLTMFDSITCSQSLIVKITDPKEFKKFLKTHINVLAIATKTDKDFLHRNIFDDISIEIKGLASIVHIDCSSDKKLCKKLKLNPNPIEYKHYSDGKYNKDYDRKINLKSLINFLRDPKGDIPWDEDENALDVRHINTKKEFEKLLSNEKKPMLIMFYAPWCSFCKRLKPDFARAATEVKGTSVLVGVDVDKPDLQPIRSQYNITGFPTIIYFQEGKERFKYGGENTKEGIVKWLKDPGPPKEQLPEPNWSEFESDVIHLTDETFDAFVEVKPSVLVLFYAPWCGHCKKIKPEYVHAAATMKTQEVEGVLAAVDATKETKISERMKIKGYPTLKYFLNGVEAYETNSRDAEALVEFMRNPQPPPAEEAPWDAIQSEVVHLTDENFNSFLKKKKHCLVMFYAPWCGHCKKAKPEFSAAADRFKEDSKTSFAALDCTKHQKICEVQTISGYPTLLYYNYGKTAIKYSGNREAKDFIAFMLDPTGDPNARLIADYWSQVPGSEILVQLNASNFETTLKQYTDVVVLFYSLGCIHCTEMRASFVAAAHHFRQENLTILFTVIDGLKEAPIRIKYDVTGFPSIMLFRNGELYSDMNVDWTTENIIHFVTNPEPLPLPWTNYPGSVKHLTAFNFDKMAGMTTKMLVMWYLPSCRHSNNLRQMFWDASDLVDNPENIFAVVDCSKYSDFCKVHKIVEYPTFKLYVGARAVSTMNEKPKTMEGFMEFFSQEAEASVKMEL